MALARQRRCAPNCPGYRRPRLTPPYSKVGPAPTPSLARDSRPQSKGRRRGGLQACPVTTPRSVSRRVGHAHPCAHALPKGRPAGGTRAGSGMRSKRTRRSRPAGPPSPLSLPPGPRESDHGGRRIVSGARIAYVSLDIGYVRGVSVGIHSMRSQYWLFGLWRIGIEDKNY